MLNEKIYPHFISDSPKGIDCFEEHTQEQLAANICKYIKSIDSEPDKKLGGNIPRIIGIEGGWGSGKSNVDIKRIYKGVLSLKPLLMT